jgi:hypothetical protein
MAWAVTGVLLTRSSLLHGLKGQHKSFDSTEQTATAVSTDLVGTGHVGVTSLEIEWNTSPTS